MQILKILPEDRERLLKVPEFGMGYQLLRSRQFGRLQVVLNATVVFPWPRSTNEGFSEADYGLLSGDPDKDEIQRLSSFDWADVLGLLSPSPVQPEIEGADHQSSIANPIPPSTTIIPIGRPRSYYRFSAFFKDRRVTPSGFVPGTYATTFNDLPFVPSGFAAVGRYALPNPASAQFVFQITTFDRPALMGSAAPNFGQAGGGVEVMFSTPATHSPGISFMIHAG